MRRWQNSDSGFGMPCPSYIKSFNHASHGRKYRILWLDGLTVGRRRQQSMCALPRLEHGKHSWYLILQAMPSLSPSLTVSILIGILTREVRLRQWRFTPGRRVALDNNN